MTQGGELARSAAQTIGRLPPRCAAISAGGVERVVELVQVPAQPRHVVRNGKRDAAGPLLRRGDMPRAGPPASVKGTARAGSRANGLQPFSDRRGADRVVLAPIVEHARLLAHRIPVSVWRLIRGTAPGHSTVQSDRCSRSSSTAKSRQATAGGAPSDSAC